MFIDRVKNGVECIEQIEKQPTANAFAEDKKKALEFGMNDHIAKPIDMNIVIQVLKKYI